MSDSQYITIWNVKYFCSDQNFDFVPIVPQIYVYLAVSASLSPLSILQH